MKSKFSLCFIIALIYVAICIAEHNALAVNHHAQHTEALHESFDIFDYILSFKQYHFEWSTQYFSSETLLNPKHKHTNEDITTCTNDIPSLCINYTPNKPGFRVLFNESQYDFLSDDDWTQINYIHANDSITLYDEAYRSQIASSSDLTDTSLDDAFFEEEEEYDDDEDDELDAFQSPNPDFAGRRLLRRRKAKCRVYLYRLSKFGGRIGSFSRRAYRATSLRRAGYKGSSVRSVKVRGSRCCTARLYTKDGYRGRRVRFRRGRYSRIRSRRHQIRKLGSMKIYCSRSRGRSRRRRSRRGRRCPCRQCPCRAGGAGAGAGGGGDQQPIPILLGPMTGMLGHFGYSMHPMIPPQMAAMSGMQGNYGNGMGMPMMSHPSFGQPSMGSGYGFGMGMGGMPAMGAGMGGMPGMGMANGMMPGMGMGGMMGQGAAKTPVVHVYPDQESARRRSLLLNEQTAYYDGVAINKCVVVRGAEICATYYFALRVVSLDYTVMNKRMLRIDYEDDGEMVDDDEDENDVLSVEYEDSESMDEDEESEEGDDEYEWMMQHDDYEMYRNEQIFQLEVSEQVQGIDYVNTVSWIWNAHGCDEKVLSFVHMSLCTNATKDGQNKNDIVISTKPVDDDLEAAIQWNVRNQMDWEQIYEVKMQDRQTNMRLCKTLAMIKLCVEMTEDEYVTGNIKEMQMSAEFV